MLLYMVKISIVMKVAFVEQPSILDSLITMEVCSQSRLNRASRRQINMQAVKLMMSRQKLKMDLVLKALLLSRLRRRSVLVTL